MFKTKRIYDFDFFKPGKYSFVLCKNRNMFDGSLSIVVIVAKLIIDGIIEQRIYKISPCNTISNAKNRALKIYNIVCHVHVVRACFNTRISIGTTQ